VAAQARVAPGERMDLDLDLAEGAYRLRGPQLAYAIDLRIQPTALSRRLDLNLARSPGPGGPRSLRPGGQTLAVSNDTSQELVFRIERVASRDDAFTAGRASALALFRELFPGEVLSPGQLVSVTSVTLLATELDAADNLYRDLGDAQAFAVVHEHFRLLEEAIRQEGGALVKTIGEGLIASFPAPTAAVRAGLRLQSVLASHPATRHLRLRVGIHLDYFGTTVKIACELPRLVTSGELAVSEPITTDLEAAALLQSSGADCSVAALSPVGQPSLLVQKWQMK
jgi:class 3 adenylate cyclase